MVFINQSSGYLMVDVVNAFVRSGKYSRVALVSGCQPKGNTRLSPEVDVRKIIGYNRSSLVKRMLSWGAGTMQIFFLLLSVFRKYEVMYVTNPPMAYLLSLVLPNRFSVIIYDVYPDALKNIGIQASHFLYRKWEKWNRRAFEKADRIFALSEGMAVLLSRYVSPEKICVVPLWTDTSRFRPLEKSSNPFVREQGLDGKFIVLYSGNIGYTHNVESIIEVANTLKEVKDVYFLIIGEGGKKSALEKLSKEYGLENCRFLTWQPQETLPYSLAAADLAVVTINEKTARLSVPSKTFNLMAVGVPLLCIAPGDSELHRLVEKYDIGRCFDREATDEMADYIVRLKSDREFHKRLSERSRKAAAGFTEKNAEDFIREE